jgi:hypothetical protein
MKKPLAPVMVLAAAAAFFAAATPCVTAQTSPVCDIKKITPSLLNSPQITAEYSRKPGQNRSPQWLEVDVEFDMPQPSKSGPKFADELTVNYYILLNNKDTTEDRKPTLLSGSVSHADVPYGKGLHVGAFVSPQTMLRFFDGKAPGNINQAVVDVGVTVSDASGVVARHALKSQVRGDKGWWDNTADFSEVTGRVLSKDATPFAHLSWDYYLPPKSKAGF